MAMQRGSVPIARILGLLVVLLATVAVHLALPGTRRFPVEPAWYVRGGDADRGRIAIRQYGCGACHVVQGIPTASGRVGPRLTGLTEQVYLAGVLPNTPSNLMTWIREPQRVDPQTAMPNLQVTEADARDIAAYLYSTR